MHMVPWSSAVGPSCSPDNNRCHCNSDNKTQDHAAGNPTSDGSNMLLAFWKERREKNEPWQCAVILSCRTKWRAYGSGASTFFTVLFKVIKTKDILPTTKMKGFWHIQNAIIMKRNWIKSGSKGARWPVSEMGSLHAKHIIEFSQAKTRFIIIIIIIVVVFVVVVYICCFISSFLPSDTLAVALLSVSSTRKKRKKKEYKCEC